LDKPPISKLDGIAFAASCAEGMMYSFDVNKEKNKSTSTILIYIYIYKSFSASTKADE
jgi:hypothetical protein